MSTTRDAVHVTRSLRLSTSSGDPVPAKAAWFRASEPARMRVLVAWHHWERIARDRLFDLDDDTVPTDLVPDVDVVIETRLPPDADVTFPDDVRTLRTRLADPAEPLRATGTWTATDVRQHAAIPDEEDLTESVFADDTEPRAHAATIEIRQRSRPGRRPDETGSPGATGSDGPGGSPGATGSDGPGGSPGATGSDGDSSGSIDVGELLDESDGASAAAPGPELASVLEPVVAALDASGWTYQVDDDGSRVSLVATLDDRQWDVVVRPGERDGWCSITSVHPESVPAVRRDRLATRLLAYNAGVDRGAFEVDDGTGAVRFRTPFVPTEESVTDAVGENVTAMAEWFDEIDDAR